MDITDWKSSCTVYPISRHFSKKNINKTLNYQTSVWLDDKIVVQIETKKHQERLLYNTRETYR